LSGSIISPRKLFTFLETKTFHAGLTLNGRVVHEGDLSVQIHLAEAGHDYTNLVNELRGRSRQETKSIFWAVAQDEAIERETVGAYRSKEMITRKEREARTVDQTALVAEEKVRLGRHGDELKRLLKTACLAGTVFFRGNDRSPSDR
jgi:hypothetical protein